MQKQRIPVWDIPTRVFHWSIVACVLLSWWSGETNNYTVHEWTGYSVIVLVMTRIAWGFLGSRHARFADFLVGPRNIIAYLKGRGAASAGHNPLGGWSVVAMLLLLLTLAISGLFNTDDVLFSGPLYYAAEADFRDTMGVVHDITFNVLLTVIALHISAVLYYQLRLREKLVQAMVRGSAAGREGRAQPIPAWRALAILMVFALALWWGLEQAPQPQPVWW